MPVISERTRELLIEVEKSLKDQPQLQERVRGLRLQVDKEIEAQRRE
jgi:hypothetical protein